MSNKIRQLLIILITCIYFIGCSSAVDTLESTESPSHVQPSNQVASTQSTPDAPLATATTSPAPVVTSTSIPLTSTSTVTSQISSPEDVATPTLSTTIQSPSIPIDPPIVCTNSQTPISINSEEGFSGTLGLAFTSLEDFGNGDVAQVILLGGRPLQEKVFLPINQTDYLGFSPNGNWFAYQSFDNGVGIPPQPFVYLLSASGERINTPIPLEPTETNGYWTSLWLTDELMLMSYGLPQQDENQVTLRTTLLIFNPFTGERLEGILETLPYWNKETSVYFSPDMTRVVYVSDFESPIKTSLILWDVEQQEILWTKSPFEGGRIDEVTLGATSGFRKLVSWSPDSSKFIFVNYEGGGEETAYSIDRNGTEEVVLVQASNGEGTEMSEGVWSPDGRYFAYTFRESVEVAKKYWLHIMLYDFALINTFEVCARFEDDGGIDDQVIWSPDSRQLAAVSIIDGQDYLVLLNIYTGDVIVIRPVTRFFPAGWVENEEWLVTD